MTNYSPARGHIQLMQTLPDIWASLLRIVMEAEVQFGQYDCTPEDTELLYKLCDAVDPYLKLVESHMTPDEISL